MFEGVEFFENEDLKKHTTFNIGGKARYFVLPKSISELKNVLKILKTQHIPRFVIGNGSNLLVDDEGFDGTIISLKRFNRIKFYKKLGKVYVTSDSGTDMFKLNEYLKDNNISGLEWSYGIPGTVGGGAWMNCGAYGHNLYDFISEIVVLKDQKIKKIKNPKAEYRSTGLSDEVILSVKFELNEGKKDVISRNMKGFWEIRKSKQPLSLPSAGSVFKRKDDLIPSKIIDERGLKGLRIGDAMVSTKHAGFIVNVGSATSSDVLRLIDIISSLCPEPLEREIIYLKSKKE